jgi:hypothetical protein
LPEGIEFNYLDGSYSDSGAYLKTAEIKVYLDE